MAAEPSRSARGILVDWANRQDDWARAVVAEVLSSRTSLSGEARDELRKIFLAEKRLSDARPRAVPRLVDEAHVSGGATTFRLIRLRDCQNVNRLIGNQEIVFGPRVTILYGENASGKTGYVRILKRVSGVRGAQRVLPDITALEAGPPAAEIEYEIDGEARTLQWRDEPGLQPFNRITVFDTPTASIHLTDSLEYVFTPADLSLYEVIHAEINALRKDLGDEIESRRPPRVDFVAEFKPGTEAYAMVQTLGVGTSLSQLEALATVSEQDRGAIRELTQRVDALRPETSRATMRKLTKQISIIDQVLPIVHAMESFRSHDFSVKRTTLKAAEGARSSELNTVIDSDLGESSASFQAFLEAADSFLRSSGRRDYPSDEDRCIYCRQSLEFASRELLQRYRVFCEGSSAELVKRLQSDVAEQYRVVTRADPTGAIGALGSVDGDALRVDDGVGARLRQFLESLTEVRSDGIEVEVDRLAGVVATAESLRIELSSLRTRLDEDLSTASVSNAERERLLAEARKQLDERSDRLTLGRHFVALREFVQYEVWLNKATTHLRGFQGVLKTLTEASKQASEQALQRDFESRFRRECRALRAPAVAIQFPGRQGRTIRSKTLSPGYDLDAVLSEGEQKVLALADFLSEGLLRDGSSPIVFDDPVNSLDYRRLHEVVDRVVELSQDQQVVIFTHNVWFASEILGRFEKNPDAYKFYEISDVDGSKGVVSSRPRPRTDSISDTKSEVERVIAAARDSTGEDREVRIERAYDAIRNWCEMFVEQEVLCSITERYSPHVGVTKLKNLKISRMKDASDEVMSIYEKSCRQLKSHSQPRETLNVRATLQELESDWSDALECRKKFNAK